MAKSVRRRPGCRHTHFPTAGFGIPVTQTELKAFRVVERLWARNNANIINVPAWIRVVTSIVRSIDSNEVEGELDCLPGISREVNARAGPHISTSVGVLRGNNAPGIGANLDLNFAVVGEVLRVKIIPVLESQARILIHRRHDKRRAD
jgi:hypothetical protein